MKASHSAIARVLLLTSALLAAGCVPAPDSTPAPSPSPVQTAPAPSPTPSPVAAAEPKYESWMDAPRTPGTWRYVNKQAAYVERDSNGPQAPSVPLFIMDCNGSDLRLMTRTAAEGATPITIRTETRDRTLSASVRGPAGDEPRFAEAVISARDPLLDAMALTKGRFAVETPDSPTLYLPAWAEVTRVIEDCR